MENVKGIGPTPHLSLLHMQWTNFWTHIKPKDAIGGDYIINDLKSHGICPIDAFGLLNDGVLS